MNLNAKTILNHKVVALASILKNSLTSNPDVIVVGTRNEWNW